MIKLSTIAISISLLVIGCTNNKIELDNQNAANEIVAACIKKMIGTGDTARMAFEIRQENFPADFPEKYREEHQRMYDSTKKTRLSIDPYIVVIDSLMPYEEDTLSIKSLLKDTAFRNIDTAGYAGLISNKYFKKINTDYIAQQIRIKVTNKEPWTKKEQLNYHDTHFIALFTFSRIKYDTEKKIAFVYGGAWCGGKCGFGYYMFLSQRNNEWEVINFTITGES